MNTKIQQTARWARIAALGLSMGAFGLPLSGQVDPASIDPRPISTTSAISEDFADYNGTLAKLRNLGKGPGKSGFVTTSDNDASDPDLFHDGEYLYSTGDTCSIPSDSFYAVRGSGPLDQNRAFGILEGGSGSSGLRDARLFLKIKNTGSVSIKSLTVTFDVGNWVDGSRVNKIRLKYNTSPTGFGSISDLISVLSPEDDNDDSCNDGFASSDHADVEFDLPTALAPNGVAYLRWQYSKDSGSGTRDLLSIDNITVTASDALIGTDTDWTGGTTGNWNTTETNWDSTGTWANDGTENAVFNTSAGGTVTLTENIEARDIRVEDGDWTLDGTSELKVLGTIFVDSGKTLTIEAPLTVGSSVRKSGTGTLILKNSTNDIASLLIQPGGGEVEIDEDLVTGQLISDDDASNTVEIKSGDELTVRSTSVNGTFRGSLTGAGTLNKEGEKILGLRDNPKAMTGPVHIDRGPLEVSQKGRLTATSGVIVYGSDAADNNNDYTEVGELRLRNSSSVTGDGLTLGTAPSVTIGLHGGQLASDEDNDIDLANDILLYESPVSTPFTANRIYARSGSEFTLSGDLLNATGSDSGGFEKRGGGKLIIAGTGNTFSDFISIRNGDVEVASGSDLGTAKLLFQSDANDRKLILNGNLTVKGLDGNGGDDEMQPTTAEIQVGTHTFTIDQPDEVTSSGSPVVYEEVDNRYQGEITGTGTLIKDGLGLTRLSKFEKTFDGDVEVREGVLAVSAKAKLLSIDSLTVEDGGQLRLSSQGGSGGDPVAAYDFGSNIVLKSTGRAIGGDIQTGRDLGILGGLRYDPGGAPDAQTATLADNIVVDENASLHVNALNNTLTLDGTISGTAGKSLTRAGGGTLVFKGDITLDGPITFDNGINVFGYLDEEDDPVAIDVFPAMSTRTLTVNDDGQQPTVIGGFGSTINGNLTINDGAGFRPRAVLAVDLTVEEDMTLPASGTLVIDLAEFPASPTNGDYVIVGFGNTTAPTLPGTIDFVNDGHITGKVFTLSIDSTNKTLELNIAD